MKEAGLILDLYQSPIQGERDAKKAVSDFYVPLLKLLKTKKNITVSLNIPLTTIEALDKYGHGSLISDIKELYENDRVEIVGSSPYNSSIMSFSKKIIEDQIILNEYGVGYHLGSRQGFEGEPSIMVRDIEGFVPPYGASENLLDILGDLGYRWVAVNGSISGEEITAETPNSYIYGESFLHEIEGKDMVVVRTFNDISHMIYTINKKDGLDNGFEENFSIRKKELSDKFNNILDRLKDSEKDGVVFRVGDMYVNNCDPDLREYIYKEIFRGVELLVDLLEQRNVKIYSVRDLLKSRFMISLLPTGDLNKFFTSDEPILNYDKESPINKDFLSIEGLLSGVMEKPSYTSNNDDFTPLSMWKDDEIRLISDINLRNNIRKMILFNKFVCMDKYVCPDEITGTEIGSERLKSKLDFFSKIIEDLIEIISDESIKENLSKEAEKLRGDLQDFLKTNTE